MSLVVTRNLVRTYGTPNNPVHALRGINLELKRGELVALRGRSGSGKTTLLNLIGGLDQPTSGDVLFDGIVLASMSEVQLDQLRRTRIGFVFQSFALMPLLSASENVELPLRIAGIVPAERERRAAQAISVVGLTKWAHHRPFEMSGGQQQRVAVARALAAGPDVILADEPTAEVDSRTANQIVGLFRQLVSEVGVCVCLTTHDPAVVEMMDKTYTLTDGVISGVLAKEAVAT